MRLLSRPSFLSLLGSGGTILSSRAFAPQQSYNYHQRTAAAATLQSLSLCALPMSTNNNNNNKPIVQYIFLRRDLDWPAGAMAAQAAHASVAAVTQGLAAGDASTAAYIAPTNLPRMTKMVYGVENLEELQRVQKAWNQFMGGGNHNDNYSNNNGGGDGDDGSGVANSDPDNTANHHQHFLCHSAYLWIEQPENIPTALATWPVARTNKVSKVVKNLKLTYF